MRAIAVVWTLTFWLSCVLAPLFALATRIHGAQLFAPEVLTLVRVTTRQAGWSVFFSALLGLPLGLWVDARGPKTVRHLAEAALSLPFAVPTVVAALSWVLILGRHGLLGRLDWGYSMRAVIIAHVFFNAPWVALVVAQTRRLIPEGRLQAARLLGSSPMSCFWFIEWPALKWAFLSVLCQVFAFCVMSFALILILGGGPPVESLETAIYSHIRLGGLDLGAAVACAAWELLITLVPWGLVLFFSRGPGRGTTRGGEPPKNVRSVTGTPLVTSGLKSSVSSVIALGVGVFFILPYFSLFFSVFSAKGFQSLSSSEWWQIVFPAAWVSLRIALCSAVLVVLSAAAAAFSLARLSAERPGLTALLAGALSLSGGMSALVLGLGFWLAFGAFIDPFEGSFTAIIAIQTALFFNLAFRLLRPLATQPQRGLLEAANLLGARPLRAFFEVEWVRYRPAVLSAFAWVLAASLGEVAAVSLFYSEKLVPLPLLMARWSAQYRFAEAEVIGLLLFLMAAVAVLTVYGQRGRESIYENR